MEILMACIAMGIATIAIILVLYALAQISKLEEAVHKGDIQILDLIKQQCEINKKQQAIDAVIRRRLNQTAEVVLTAASEIEKLKKERK